jgi:tRNA threonylcarbamoyladenosine modification (KEOPS) complex Cgi121 subunit
MEILLYSSGERQLKLAIPKMGVKKGKTNIAFVFLNDDKIFDDIIKEFLKKLSLVRKDIVLEGNENTLKLFGIDKKEIETVSKEKYGNLILEKVALVDLIK